MAWRMPAEWAPHARTWMAWPNNAHNLSLGGGPETAFRAWAEVANAVVAFEPVTMVCPPGESPQARDWLDPQVEIREAPLGDAWMRDIGPTFVLDDEGQVGAVDWTFNGWGGRGLPEAVADVAIARTVADWAGAAHLPSKLINEGGGLHVDGEGTVLLTETVQLNPNRNPNWSRAEVEAEIHDRLGTEKAIWLKAGLVGDEDENGTDGHVDTLAAFVAPGVVVVHGQPDKTHPDHAIAAENEALLRQATDARGQALEVIVLDAPAHRGRNDVPLSCSYVNFAFVNGGLILCGYDDPQDAKVATIFAELLPEREIRQLPALPLFARGGGVHCITQHQPASGKDAP